jgi:rhomboid family protein
MIPLKALTPWRRTPVITVALILANALVFFYELSLGPQAIERFFFQYGMIPARIQAALTTGGPALTAALVPIFTSMFLHGGWLHIIGNMWFLWVFGIAVEDQLGSLRYLAFYLVCGLGAALTQAFVSWGSRIPTIGASGAISGIMGAYLVLLPTSRVLTLVPLIIFWFTVRLPAIVMIGYWFLIQLLGATVQPRNAGGVAFWAHVGGFALGAVLALPVRRAARSVLNGP